MASCAVALAVGLLVHKTTLGWLMNQGRSQAYVAMQEDVATYLSTGVAPDSYTPQQIPPVLIEQVDRSGGFTTWYDDRRPDSPWMWAAQPVDGRVLFVQIDMGTAMRSLQALDRHVVEASLAVLAVVVPLAALAAELPNRRLRRVARTARRIADGDLDARAMRGGRRGRDGDEITEISVAVDAMAGALQERLLSEQRFTADVAHELRTPLMGLVTSTELLPAGEATELVRDRVRALRSLVEDLLEITRIDAGVEQADLASVPLDQVVEESVHRTEVRARLTVTGAPVAYTDPRRLNRIIANLVINAHRHGRPPVEVTVSGTTIVVRDHGPGFPEALLVDGPQRFRTGAAERGRGHGLGLTIASGHARVIGGRLTFGNAPDGGAIARLHLPAGDRT
ncbi:sensor histidine kinase [Actinoallomurus soli]|uniref:sensor histidine kinase n=1 Tax=Actinoallomurus soli TaxID=2952535 RepID=UPI0020927EEF|nr:HAMP domain-containing sensor histidine kinase [Actinoallomurus soli]MCO5973774.1 HAMP domain-containing histidine kinase [Actinoallomurus soli]